MSEPQILINHIVVGIFCPNRSGGQTDVSIHKAPLLARQNDSTAGSHCRGGVKRPLGGGSLCGRHGGAVMSVDGRSGQTVGAGWCLPLLCAQ